MSSKKSGAKWLAAFGLVLIIFFAIALFEGIGLTLFYLFFGNNTPVIVLKYSIVPVGSPAEKVIFSYTLYLTYKRVPVEIQMLKSEVKELGPEIEMPNRKFTLILPIQINTEKTQIFSQTFYFYDTKPREISFYLTGVNKGDKVSFICNGYYTLEAIDPIDMDSHTREISLSRVFGI